MNEDAVTRHPWANGEAGEMREGEVGGRERNGFY